MSASASSVLDDLLARITALPQDAQDALKAQVAEQTGSLVWVPNPGPQTKALESEADELFYGGEAGGGKSDLAIGAALTQHRLSLILRRYIEDARSLAERAVAITGDRSGYSMQPPKYYTDRWRIDFGGCKELEDRQRYKGKPKDLIAFDEVGDFLEKQYRFIIGWNRSTDPKQRVRVICTGNPPTEKEGLWVIQYWGAWLDPTHPNPAHDGELRWYTTTEDGVDAEVDGRGPHTINGETVYAKSRTFIRARLDDNPELVQTDDYRANLAALPPELRAAYRDGNFAAGLKDDPWQVIPTAWVVAAQERWVQRPLPGVPMCAIGVDVAQGGEDDNVLAPRYDGWYPELTVVPGSETPLGRDIGGHVVMLRRDGASVVLDCGGGYGGAPYQTLKSNGVPVHAYKGAEASSARTEDGKLTFYNMRAQTMWRFREALDPGQPFGSPIALPPDRRLLADLTATHYHVGARGIQLEPAETVEKRIGRSPDRAIAVILSWSAGKRAVAYQHMGLGSNAEHGIKSSYSGALQTKAVLGHRGARSK